MKKAKFVFDNYSFERTHPLIKIVDIELLLFKLLTIILNISLHNWFLLFTILICLEVLFIIHFTYFFTVEGLGFVYLLCHQIIKPSSSAEYSTTTGIFLWNQLLIIIAINITLIIK